MYQPYPGGDQVPEPSPRPPAPQSVLRAVQIMYVGAAASLIGIVIDLTTLSDTKARIHQRSPTLTPAQVNSAEHFLIGGFIVAGLLGAALWLWMAQSTKAGKSWARIVSTVLFGIDTLDQVAGAAVPSGGVVRIYSILIWLIGLAAVVLLWQRTSTDYFKGAPRY
jgi:asparagine N-glycosylation enzyme membrane subunit Stt3